MQMSDTKPPLRISIFDDDKDEADSLGEAVKSLLENTYDVKVSIYANRFELVKGEAEKQIPENKYEQMEANIRETTQIFIVDVQVEEKHAEPGYLILKDVLKSLGIVRPIIVITGQDKVDLDKIQEDEKEYGGFKAFLRKSGAFAEKVVEEIEKIQQEEMEGGPSIDLLEQGLKDAKLMDEPFDTQNDEEFVDADDNWTENPTNQEAIDRCRELLSQSGGEVTEEIKGIRNDLREKLSKHRRSKYEGT